MNPLLPTSTLIDTLGWTLLHFCWQAAVAALIYAAIRGGNDRYDASVRYKAAVGILVAMLAAPAVTFWILTIASGAAPMAPLTQLAPIPDALPGGDGGLPPSPLSWTFVAVTVWAAGVALCSLRFLGCLWRWQLVRRHARLLLEEEEVRLIRGIARRLGLRARLELRVSAEIVSPVVIGFFRYTLLLPVTFFSGLAAAQAEAILAHELAHIYRRDGLVNMMQAIAETLFFFHPAVWWLSREVRREREKSCDILATRIVGDRGRYAEALLALEELRPAPAGIAMAAKRGSLEERIRHILSADLGAEGGMASFRAGLLLSAGLLAGVALLAGTVWAASGALQEPPAPPAPPAAPAAPAAPQIPRRIKDQGPLKDGGRLNDGLPVVAPAPPREEPGFAPRAEAPLPPQPPPASTPVTPVVAPSRVARPALAPVAPEAPKPSALRNGEPTAPATAPARPALAAPAATVRPAHGALARLAQAQEPAPAPAPRPGAVHLPSPNRQAKLEALRRELEDGAYKRWVLEDAAYIIRDEELAAFQRLGTDEERARFIEQFWKRRDPTPDTERNEAKEEHYRRISWANSRFGAGTDTPGWRTEQGRTYIQFGPPDEIEDHPRPKYQIWFYREIPGVGRNVYFEFGERRGLGPKSTP